MKKMLCSLVAVSMIAVALPAAAATGETANTTPAPPAVSIHTAIQHAAARVELQPAAPAAQSATAPLSMPRQGSSQVRHQGSGHVGMVVGVLSSLIGVATTVYVVKQMQKTTDQAKQQQQ